MVGLDIQLYNLHLTVDAVVIFDSENVDGPINCGLPVLILLRALGLHL